MPRKRTSQFWNDGLQLVSFCPLCETEYNPTEAKELGEKGDARLLHITCKGCSNSFIALMLLNQGGVSSVGLITDLSYKDVMKFKDSPSVDTDDVLEVHGALEDEKRFWGQVGS